MEVVLKDTWNDNIQSGRTRPPIISNEPLMQSLVLLDSSNSELLAGESPFNFRSNTGINLFRCRAVSLQECIIPKMNNITINNNNVILVHEDGVINFSLTPGLYSPGGFINEFVALCNAELLGLASLDTISGTYNATTRQITFVSSLGKKFFFSESCSYIVYGLYFCPFTSYPETDDPLVIGSPSQTSSIAAFLYTRYITVHSQALCNYQYTESTTSDELVPGDIIGIFNTTNIYTPDDFSVGSQFSSNYSSIKTTGSRINLLNSQKNVSNIIDIFCLDEYNIPLQNCYEMGSGYANTMGITLFLTYYF